MRHIALKTIGNRKQKVLQESHAMWELMREEMLAHGDETSAIREAAEKVSFNGNTILGSYLQYNDRSMKLLMQSSWANRGYRILTCSPKLAASLMCTAISKDVIDNIDFPWPCFAVDIPSGLIYVTGYDGKPVEACLAIIRHGYVGISEHKRYSHVIYGNDPLGTILYGSWDNVSEATSKAWSHEIAEENCLFSLEKTSLDDKATKLLWRLVVGLVVLSQDRSNVRLLKQSSSSRSNSGRQPGPPLIRAYDVRGTTTIDCRQSVRDYQLRTNRSTVTVQTLVSGHYRNQPHGQGRRLRKIIWIEPFWRGPKDAPVSVTLKRVVAQDRCDR